MKFPACEKDVINLWYSLRSDTELMDEQFITAMVSLINRAYFKGIEDGRRMK